MNKTFLTFDTDWCPEFVLDPVINLLYSYNIPSVIFATHHLNSLANHQPSFLDVGLHPNFNPLLYGSNLSAESILCSLLELYPNATGQRSHSRTISGPLLTLLDSYNIRYEANQIIPGQVNLSAYKFLNLYRYTDFWQDDLLLLSSPNNIPEFRPSLLQTAGLKIFNFHPIHIYLNSQSLDQYNSVKLSLCDKSLLDRAINTESYGIKDYFIDFLEYLRSTATVHSLSNLYTDSLKPSPAPSCE